VGRDGTAYSGDSSFGKSEYFFLWGWTAQITPDLAGRARDFLVDVIRHGDGNGEFDPSVQITGIR
jgi:hypothetical protein